MSSDTPRTDAAADNVRNAALNLDLRDGGYDHDDAYSECVNADFARQLERDLATAQSQLAAARLDTARLDRLERALRNEYVTFGYSERNHFWLDEMNGQSMTDGDTLRAAIDALPKQQEGAT